MTRKRKAVSAGVDPEYLEKQRKALLRKHRYVIYLNDNELSVIDEYCTRFKVSSKSALCREAVMSKLLNELEENHPTLF